MNRSGRNGKGGASADRAAIAQSMRSARLEAGLKQSELAELMATSRTTITRMESGRDFPQIATLERWAELTGKQLEIRLV
ncbi:MAG: helix-turn-helix transcriptional regulator [Acidobacteriaceae bacterium]